MGVAVDETGVPTGEFPRLTAEQAVDESVRYRRVAGAAEILSDWQTYRATIKSEAESDSDRSTDVTFPYLAVIREKLGGFPLRDRANPGSPNWSEYCAAIVRDKLTHPCLLELLFCYWHEEGGLVQTMNDTSALEADLETPGRRLVSAANGFQSHIDSIHWYPYAVAIEKRSAPLAELVAPKHGTEWEPFLE